MIAQKVLKHMHQNVQGWYYEDFNFLHVSGFFVLFHFYTMSMLKHTIKKTKFIGAPGWFSWWRM